MDIFIHLNTNARQLKLAQRCLHKVRGILARSGSENNGIGNRHAR